MPVPFLGPHILEAFGNQTSTGIALEFNVHTFSLNVRHSTLVFDRLPGFRKSVFEIGAVWVSLTIWNAFTPTAGSSTGEDAVFRLFLKKDVWKPKFCHLYYPRSPL